jgi:hypothetical protein
MQLGAVQRATLNVVQVQARVDLSLRGLSLAYPAQ